MNIFEKAIRKLFPALFQERKELLNAVKKQGKTLTSIIEQYQMTQNELIAVKNEIANEVAAAKRELASARNETRKEFTAFNHRLQRYERRQLEYMDPALYPHIIKQWYQHITGNILDLDNPRSFNEKIQWLKLYDRDPRKTLLADKYLAREWVAGKIGEQYLTPLLGVYHRGSEIDFGVLPNQFVLKANHGFHMNAIVKDKSSEDLDALRKTADSWLADDFAFHCFEFHYNDIPRRLIVEEYIENLDGGLSDYKFWCFNGKVHFIELIINRKSTPQMALLDTQWNRLPYTTNTYPSIETIPEKPLQLSEMIHLSEILSDGFAHVRVDLYLLDNGDIRFGEMTFTTSAGLCRWNPPEADLWVGDMLQLPDK